MRISGSALTAHSPISDPVTPVTDIAVSTKVTSSVRTKATRYLWRQYHTRRRATTSSASSSRPAPKRLARGISLWARTSIPPRKAMTKKNVASSDQPSGQSWTA